MSAFVFSRSWAMANRDTFSVGPIRDFIRPYVERHWASVDPFARNSELAKVTNDLDPSCATNYHMEAEAFCREMARQRHKFDLAFFDPPYSPRQISECYRGVGLKVTAQDTQNAALYSRVRDALLPILTDDAVVLSFGWNSNGMGKGRGFKIIELALVAHGGAHNDTICIAERRIAQVGRSGNRQDRETGLGPKDEHAVGSEADDAPQSGPNINGDSTP